MYGWINSNYMMICKKKITQKIVYLVHIYIFLSITLRKGGKFTINTAKRCLFRIIKLQPGECLFEFLVETSFILHVPFVREPSVVLETVLLLCHYSRSSISSSQISGGDLFLKLQSKDLCI